jgi:hypothetical protein
MELTSIALLLVSVSNLLTLSYLMALSSKVDRIDRRVG